MRPLLSSDVLLRVRRSGSHGIHARHAAGGRRICTYVRTYTKKRDRLFETSYETHAVLRGRRKGERMTVKSD